jgi:putative inorganic carbon (hco3(-)) transporter
MTARTVAPRLTLRGGPILATVAIVGAALLGGIGTAMTGSLLVLGAAAALVLGSILVLRPELGVLLFLAVLWLNVPAVVVDYHGVPTFVAQASILLLLLPVARYLLKHEPVIVTPALVAMLLFTGANLLSAASSSNSSLAAETVTTLLAEGLLLYVLISNAVRTPHMARLATVTIVLASVAMAGLAMHQEVTKSYGDAYLGFAQNTLQDDTERPDLGSTIRPRMEGPVGEKNRFAQVLLIAVPLALFAVRISHPFWGRALPAVAGVVILAGVFLTFSRGAFVAIALLAAVLVMRRYVRLSHMLAIVAAFALTVVIVAPEFVARVGSLGAVAGWVTGEGEDPDGAVVGRTTSNVAALLVFVDHPLTGVGPGVYAEDYSIQYANRLGLRHFVAERRAHNMYLEWAAELGIGGLAAGIAMIAITMVQLANQRSYWQARRREYADLAGAYSLALVAYAATAIFLHLSYMRYFFALLALANGVIWILQRARDRVEATAGLTGEPPPTPTSVTVVPGTDRSPHPAGMDASRARGG